MPLTIRKNLQNLIGLFIPEFYMPSIFSTHYSVVCSNHPHVFKIQLFIPNFETRFMYTVSVVILISLCVHIAFKMIF